MKKALVLAGGGTRGIYQVGAIEALKEAGLDDWNIITGTSVGALNAALLVQGDFDKVIEMYENLRPEQIVNGFPDLDNLTITNVLKDYDTLIPTIKSWVKDKGVDIEPFMNLLDEYYDEERFLASPIDFGCITSKAKGHEGVYVTKDMMKGKGKDWLLASSAAYPIFPQKTIDGEEYVDGGYYDNLPIDFALRLGAEEIIAIDLLPHPQHPMYLGREHITYVYPRVPLYVFLEFDPKKMQKARLLGYYDMQKKLGIKNGEKFTFEAFDDPSYFDDLYRSIMMLETKIRLVTPISERFRSEQLVTDTIKKQLGVDSLTPRQYLYGMLDSLLEICGEEDVTKLYTYKEARGIILAKFADAANVDYKMIPVDIENLTVDVSSVNHAGFISYFIHSNLYPEIDKQLYDMNLVVNGYDKALADLVTYMMKELGDE